MIILLAFFYLYTSHLQSPPSIPVRWNITGPFTLLFLCAYNPLFLYIYLLLSPYMAILSKPI